MTLVEEFDICDYLHELSKYLILKLLKSIFTIIQLNCVYKKFSDIMDLKDRFTESNIAFLLK